MILLYLGYGWSAENCSEQKKIYLNNNANDKCEK